MTSIVLSPSYSLNPFVYFCKITGSKIGGHIVSSIFSSKIGYPRVSPAIIIKYILKYKAKYYWLHLKINNKYIKV